MAVGVRASITSSMIRPSDITQRRNARFLGSARMNVFRPPAGPSPSPHTFPMKCRSARTSMKSRSASKRNIPDLVISAGSSATFPSSHSDSLPCQAPRSPAAIAASRAAASGSRARTGVGRQTGNSMLQAASTRRNRRMDGVTMVIKILAASVALRSAVPRFHWQALHVLLPRRGPDNSASRIRKGEPFPAFTVP